MAVNKGSRRLRRDPLLRMEINNAKAGGSCISPETDSLLDSIFFHFAGGLAHHRRIFGFITELIQRRHRPLC